MLTDAQCRNAACPPNSKRARLTDSAGLYLEVSTAGSKRWFWKTYYDGKEGRMALGSYPAVSLLAARKARDSAKRQKSDGTDPIKARKLDKLKASASGGATFEATAREWHAKQAPNWSESHAGRTLRQLERDLFPFLGARALAGVLPMELLATLRKIEERGAIETADRALMLSRQVWRYGVATGRAERDITQDLQGALTPYRGKHFAATTKPNELGELLRAMYGYKGGPIVRVALKLAPMLFQRPNELRGMAWAELDLENCLWTIPAARMKRNKDGKENGAAHLVPLPRQAVELLRELQGLTGRGDLVFPGERSHDRPMSDNSVRSALLALGYGPDRQTWHGFRATARTILAEVLEFDPLIIEAQLAHTVKDANGRAYNRTTYLKQRADMMQRWADYLDGLRVGGEVVPLKKISA
jgi:integrase